MIYRHKIITAYDLIRRSNRVNRMLNVISYNCEGLDSNGNPLTITTGTIEDPIVKPMPFEQIKDLIVEQGAFISQKSEKLKLFISEYPDADYYENTGKVGITWNDELITYKANADAMAVQVPDVKNMTQLANKKDLITSVVKPSPEIPYYDTPAFHANIINDLLDAMYYTLRSVNPDNGEVLLLSESELRDKVRMYLNVMDNASNINYGVFTKDYNDMIIIADYIKTNIDIGNLLSLSDYIGASVEKLPLFRRMWANG